MQIASVGKNLILAAAILSGTLASAKTIAVWPLGDNVGNSVDTTCRNDARFPLQVHRVAVDASTPGGWNLPPNPPSSDEFYFGSMAVRSSVKSTAGDHSSNMPVLYSEDADLVGSMYPTNASFTVEGWIRVDEFDKSQSWRVLIQIGNGGSNVGGWTLSLRNSNNGKGYYLGFFSTNLDAQPVPRSSDIFNFNFLDGTSVVEDKDIIGVWHHYAVRFEYVNPDQPTKSRWRWYVDGRLVNTYEPGQIAESDFKSKTVSSRFDIGGRKISDYQRLAGTFSYWRVSDVALEPNAFLNAGGSGSTVEPDPQLPETTVTHVPSKAAWINTGVLVTGGTRHHCTFETWVKPLDTTESMLLCQFSGGDGRTQWCLRKCNSSSMYLSMEHNVSYSVGWVKFRSTRAIPVGHWSHVAFVADGDTWKFYINGKEDNALSGCSGYNFTVDGDDGIVIGNTRTVNPNGGCNAYFAESRVWSVVRTATEIATNMNVRLGAPATMDGLIGYWPLNDGQDSFTAQNDSLFNYANINAVEYGKDSDRTKYSWAKAEKVNFVVVDDLPVSGTLPMTQSALNFAVGDKGKHSVNTHVTEAPKNMTFTGWYMRNDEGGTSDNCLFAKLSSGNGRCRLTENGGKLTFWMGGGSNGHTNEEFVISDVSAQFPVGKWTHVAFVKNGGTFSVYFNGNLAGTFSGFTMDFDPAAEFHVGGFVAAAGAKSGYNGYVKDVGIWRKAMSQDEIRSRLYTRPLGTEFALIGYWPFDDAQGDALRNLKSEGPTATPIDAGEGHFTWGLFANAPACDGVLPRKGLWIVIK